MKERVTLNKKEQSRLMVLNQVEKGGITAREGIGSDEGKLSARAADIQAI